MQPDVSPGQPVLYLFNAERCFSIAVSVVQTGVPVM
jgi:hypothetical protein